MSEDEGLDNDVWHDLDEFNHSHAGRLGGEGQAIERVMTLLEDNRIKPDDSDCNRLGSDAERTSADFVIPETPTGQKMTLKLASTWGDPFYVGLNGIEIFNINGERPQIETATATAPQSSVPIPNCMRVENLFNDFETHDLSRLWLSAYSENEPPTIDITFTNVETLAMFRIWNYNKSRVHSSRGVRELHVTLDGQPIFVGEITAAVDAENACETILFTIDEEILERIRQQDALRDGEEGAESDTAPGPIPPVSRPSTGDAYARRMARSRSPAKALVPMVGRQKSSEPVSGNQVVVELKENYGLRGWIGLTGVQLFGPDQEPIPYETMALQCDSSDESALARLTNSRNLTTNEDAMLLISFDNHTPVKLTFTLPDETELGGITIWNYNESLEMSYAGVQYIDIYINDRLVVRNARIRKAPGHLYYDFVQDVSLRPNTPRRLSPPICPAITGFVYQIQLLSTWGDDFYIGLNGFEIFDEYGEAVDIDVHNLAAYPESVNVLRHVRDDPRSSIKLIDGCNDTDDAHHMWLAPIMHNDVNRVFVVFDQPQTVSKIRIWNYRKTPTRGARDMTVLVDDTMLFSGELPLSTSEQTAYIDVLMGCDEPDSFVEAE